VIVTEIMSGSRTPRASNTFSIATIAAFALSVSKIVSSRRRSTPPSTQPAHLLLVRLARLVECHGAKRRDR
jgi:hypothetical protein